MRNLTTTIALIFSVGLYAQEAVPASGGDATGAGGSSSYTVGPAVYTTHTNSTGSAAQGVQIPYETSSTVGIEVPKINRGIVAFPNPATTSLTLSIGHFKNEKFTYQVYDIQGKLLESKQVESGSTTISTENLPKGIYLLSVLDNKTTIKTIRIAII